MPLHVSYLEISRNWNMITNSNKAIGDNRFRAPQPPETNRGQVQSGVTGRICPQATTKWTATAEQFLGLYSEGQTVFNRTSFNVSTNSMSPPPGPQETEDQAQQRALTRSPRPHQRHRLTAVHRQIQTRQQHPITDLITHITQFQDNPIRTHPDNPPHCIRALGE